MELRPVEGEPMIIFLVPLGLKRSVSVMEYEAVFNRMAVCR
jgi:hypothetical protein